MTVGNRDGDFTARLSLRRRRWARGAGLRDGGVMGRARGAQQVLPG